MPAVSKKQRIAMAIAKHIPEKLYKRNEKMKNMSKKQLSDYASTKNGDIEESEKKKRKRKGKMKK